jgi:hypothetical protein
LKKIDVFIVNLFTSFSILTRSSEPVEISAFTNQAIAGKLSSKRIIAFVINGIISYPKLPGIICTKEEKLKPFFKNNNCEK